MATKHPELFSLGLTSNDWWDIYNALVHHKNNCLASVVMNFMSKEGM